MILSLFLCRKQDELDKSVWLETREKEWKRLGGREATC